MAHPLSILALPTECWALSISTIPHGTVLCRIRGMVPDTRKRTVRPGILFQALQPVPQFSDQPE